MSDPADGGDSEYNIITCLQCSAEVGKAYVRTSQENAKLQDLISLSTEAVCSYQLGRHEMRVQGAGDMNPLSEERVTRLEEQMVKVENVLVLFNERWHAMESALRQLQQRVDVVSTPSQQHEFNCPFQLGPSAMSFDKPDDAQELSMPGILLSASRHRRRHVHRAGMGVPVLKMTASPRRSF